MRGKHNKRRLGALAAVAAAIVGCLALYGTNVVSATQLHKTWDSIFGSNKVGQVVNGRLLLPSNQWISPIGDRIQINNGRLLSSTLSPDGTQFAALSWSDFVGFVTIINVKTGKIVQQVGTGLTATVPVSRRRHGRPRRTVLLARWQEALGPADDLPGALCGRSRHRQDLEPAGGQAPARRSRRRPAAVRHGALPRRQQALRGAERRQHAGVIDDPSGTTHTLTTEIPVGNAPRQVVLAGNGAVASCPTRAAGRHGRASSPTSPTAPRSSPSRVTGAATPAPSRSSNLTSGRRRRDHGRARSRPRCTSAARRCSSPTPTTTACR